LSCLDTSVFCLVLSCLDTSVFAFAPVAAAHLQFSPSAPAQACFLCLCTPMLVPSLSWQAFGAAFRTKRHRNDVCVRTAPSVYRCANCCSRQVVASFADHSHVSSVLFPNSPAASSPPPAAAGGRNFCASFSCRTQANGASFFSVQKRARCPYEPWWFAKTGSGQTWREKR
jgi:hypothetical protein